MANRNLPQSSFSIRHLKMLPLELLKLSLKNGRFDIIKSLLDAGLDISRLKYKNDHSQLKCFCQKSHLEVVKNLIPFKDTFEGSSFIDIAISHACKEGRIKLIKRLIRSKIIAENKYHSKIYLQEACQAGNLKSIKFILSEDKFTPEDLSSALMYACGLGHLSIVQYLIEQGATPNNKDLFFACASNNIQLVNYLLCYGLDINENNSAALEGACIWGDLKLIKFLIAGNADFKKNPLLVASTCANKDIKVLKLLISIGANVKSAPEICLKYACEQNNFEIINFLISIGVDPGKYGYNAFLSACAKGNTSITLFLLNYNVDKKDKKLQGLTNAILYGHYEISNILIFRGADISKLDNKHFYSVCDYNINGVYYLYKIGFKKITVENLLFYSIAKSKISLAKMLINKFRLYIKDSSIPKHLLILVHKDDSDFFNLVLSVCSSNFTSQDLLLFYILEAIKYGSFNILRSLFKRKENKFQLTEHVLKELMKHDAADAVSLFIENRFPLKNHYREMAFCLANSFDTYKVYKLLLKHFSNDPEFLQEYLFYSKKLSRIDNIKMVLNLNINIKFGDGDPSPTN